MEVPYFGRDSMISTLLLDPILSVGKNSSVEAVLAGVLERINRRMDLSVMRRPFGKQQYITVHHTRLIVPVTMQHG